ncbi:MAG: 2-amino-4-hydroxy-6-hydroxymethyldihydropteridine diphosphokinase [Calothrix sp. SM1_7_51]|nr:2-amino-4-hydroxy-6-hydroxymethyldihydropteridine diphosphokinase [Calothrix sp. SM1_7_51]
MACSAIALGSNLGDSREILINSIESLSQIPGIYLLAQSNLYKTKPVGPPQADYLNGCITIKTDLTPDLLLDTLLRIENKFGRVRQERWGPRTLDLDLLLYDDLILESPNLQVPHPRMHERPFVLVPLAEIASNWVEPVSKLTIEQLLKKVNYSG